MAKKFEFEVATRRKLKARICLYGLSGSGKAQPLYSKVLTPSGWVAMGDLEEGDEIISVDGSVSEILQIHPQGNKDIYRVYCNDGSFTDCTEDHLWFTQTVLDRATKKPGTVKTLLEIKDTLYLRETRPNHYIPLVNPDIQFNPISLKLDPYLLGVILGDGNISQNCIGICTPDTEIIDKVRKLLPDTTELRQDKLNPITWFIRRKAQSGENPVTSTLRRYGLMGHLSIGKFIPPEYLSADKNSRIAVLQGLLDTDGYTGGHTLEYTTSSEKLAYNVKELVESLGGLVALSDRIPSYTYKGQKKEGQKNYRLFLKLPPAIIPFTVSRKLANYTPKTKYKPYRQIRKIEYIGQSEAQCITIDHPSQMYVTDNYIVTHNSYSSLQIATLLSRGKPIVVIDTENGTSSIYAKGEDGIGFDFDTLILDGDYSMDTLVDAFKSAENHVGKDGVIIIDTTSKFWAGTNGALDEINKLTGGNQAKNQQAWNIVTPKVNKAIETISSSKSCHVVCTFRCKSETIQEEYLDWKTQKTKTKALKVGLAPVFKDGIEYEFDIAIETSLVTNKDGTDSQVLRVSKPPRFKEFARYNASIEGDVEGTIKWNPEEFVNTLLFRLDQGEDPEQKQKDKARAVIGELSTKYENIKLEPYPEPLNPEADLTELRSYYTKLSKVVAELESVPQ